MRIKSAAGSKAVTAKMPKVTCEMIVINRQVARHLVDTSHFPRQRDISAANVLRLRREMENGWYVHGSPLFFAVLPDGTQSLLNGHHSLEALTDSQSTMQFTGIFHHVRDMAEAGHLYARFDIHKRRTYADAYRAVGLEEKLPFNRQWLNGYGSALRAILGRFTGRQLDAGALLMSRELQIRMFEKYLEPAAAYHAAITKRGNLSLLWARSSVFGIGLELFATHAARAYDFFHEASADDGLHRNDPRKLLHEWLRLTPCTSNKARRETAIAVSLAWNAFYKRSDLSSLSVGSVKKIRLGTPWRGHYDPAETLLNALRDPPAPAAADASYTGSGAVAPVTQHVAR